VFAAARSSDGALSLILVNKQLGLVALPTITLVDFRFPAVPHRHLHVGQLHRPPETVKLHALPSGHFRPLPCLMFGPPFVPMILHFSLVNPLERDRAGRNDPVLKSRHQLPEQQPSKVAGGQFDRGARKRLPIIHQGCNELRVHSRQAALVRLKHTSHLTSHVLPRERRI
jgi:hypothetical protein